MATTASQAPFLAAPLARAWSIFAMLGRAISLGFAVSRDHDRRVAHIKTLQTLSDAELAKRGILRDRIVHHVYADLMGQ